MSGTVVLGGGLAGLVTGWALERAGREAVVLEREAEAGGACRSFSEGGFTFDLTGHLLHVAREETREVLRELGIWDRLVVHERRAAVVIGGHVTPYPVQINTWGLADEVRRDCLLGFIRAWCEADDSEPGDFGRWVLQRFGEGLARHFFFPYNTKLFRVPPGELSVDWVGRYVPRPALEDVVDGALGLHRGRVGYNATFRYPAEGGIRLLPDAFARGLSGLRTATEVVAVHAGERWVETAAGERLAWDRLVSTISLPWLLDRLVDGLPGEVAAARRALRWVRVLNVALGVEGPPPTDRHWLYFPDPGLPFYRVGFPSNHGRVAPPGCHTVSIEVSLDPEGDSVEEAARGAEAALAEAGFLEPDRVRVRRVAVLDPAYVVFDHRRAGALAAIRPFLRSRGIGVAGRWARWTYSAMEDAIGDGLAAAREILEGPAP